MQAVTASPFPSPRAVPHKASRPDVKVNPVLSAKRINQIDILRGIALFGVLSINLLTEFRVSIFSQFMAAQAPSAGANLFVETWVPILLESKSFALFSFLFGVGLAIQHERVSKRGPALSFLTRRLLVLLGIGVVHLTLVWNGDILTEYAVAGFIALPFVMARTSKLVAGMVACFALYAAMPFIPLPIAFPAPDWITKHVQEAAVVLGRGDVRAVMSFELRELPYLLPLHLFVLPRTLGLFLLGAIAWRSGVLAHPEKHQCLLAAVAAIGLVTGGALTWLGQPGWDAWLSFTGRGGASIEAFAPVILAAGYGASIVLIASRSWGVRLLSWAAPLGRTAFTNYLLQSVVLSALFYGWGLHLYGMGAFAAFLIGLFLYVAQVIISTLWLSRYRFGPVEWLWRTLMYGERQPMRR